MAIESIAADQVATQPAGTTPTARGDVYFITGASRGLGLEMVRQLLTTSHTALIVAACRTPDSATTLQALAAQHPGRVHVIQLDATDEKSIKAAALWVENNLNGQLDVLINNAGVLEKQKPWHDIDVAEATNVLVTNTLGPLLVSSNLLPALRKGQRKTIINVSSVWGSAGLLANEVRSAINAAYPDPTSETHTASFKETDADSVTHVYYKASKSALNMETLVMARDLIPQGFIVVSIHPGWVATDMGGAGATLSPEESALSIFTILKGLRPADSGTFYNYDGTVLPW